MATRRLYSASSGASTRIQACRLLLPESIKAATGMPLATTAWYCSSFGIGLPASSRSNSTSTWRNAVTSSLRGAVLAHRVDAQEQPELGAEDAVDAALGRHLRLPLGRRERDATARDDFALVGFHGRGDGDEFVRLETCVDQPDESIVHRRVAEAWPAVRCAPERVRHGVARGGGAAGDGPRCARAVPGMSARRPSGWSCRASASVRPSARARASNWSSASSSGWPASRNWQVASKSSALRVPSGAPRWR